MGLKLPFSKEKEPIQKPIIRGGSSHSTSFDAAFRMIRQIQSEIPSIRNDIAALRRDVNRLDKALRSAPVLPPVLPPQSLPEQIDPLAAWWQK